MATAIPANQASFSLQELASAAEGELVREPDPGARVTGVVTDSRAVVPGNAFVALPGERTDGHDFLGAAIERGATAVVVRRGRSVPGGPVAVVLVDDVLAAFGSIARGHVRRWRGPQAGVRRVAAVTGSAGKTTTKELLAAILGAVGPCHATRGNLNNRVGVPAVALGLSDESYAVFELGMSVPGEIAALARIVCPDVAVLLNVGVAHAEGFGGSALGIANEKGAIFEALAPDGVAVANMDDDAVRAQLHRAPPRARRVGFGASPDADVRLVSRGRPPAGVGSRVTIARRGGSIELELPIAGEAVAMDLCAAIAAADATAGSDVPGDVIAAAVASWRPPDSRSVTLELAGDVWALDDSYNANPASMRAAFSTLAELRLAGRRRAIAVLGEMRELGPLSDREHDELGAELVQRGFELVIGCGGAIERTLRRAEAGGLHVRYAKDATEAGALLGDEVRAGDVILFKGSRAAGVERALATLLESHPEATRVAGAAG
ncbi:MAG: UDP-N-acetylmuramoyl-tripeptide--D-alanyl-D-alanine ligase [Polyangiaceae bacterium]